MNEPVINIHEEWTRLRSFYRSEFRRARRFLNKGIIDETEYIAAHENLLRETRAMYKWYRLATMRYQS